MFVPYSIPNTQQHFDFINIGWPQEIMKQELLLTLFVGIGEDGIQLKENGSLTAKILFLKMQKRKLEKMSQLNS